MKRIKVNNLNKGDKTNILTRKKFHSIMMGNNLKCYFSNYRAAKRFIASTNAMLNINAQLLNRLYIDTWTAQRNIYLTHHTLFLRNRFTDEIIMIEKSFDLLCTRSHFVDGNHFSFKHFYNILYNIEIIIERIRKVLKDNHKTYDLEIFRILREQLLYIRNNLDNWGLKYAENAPQCFLEHDNIRKPERIEIER